MAGSDYIACRKTNGSSSSKASVAIIWYSPADSSTKWRIRYRTRTRTDTGDFGRWSAWTEPTSASGETCTKGSGSFWTWSGMENVRSATVMANTGLNGFSVEVQVRNATSDGGWFGNTQDGSQSVYDCYMKPDVSNVYLTRNAEGYIAVPDSTWPRGWRRIAAIVVANSDMVNIYRIFGPPTMHDSGEYAVLEQAAFVELPVPGEQYMCYSVGPGSLIAETTDGVSAFYDTSLATYTVVACNDLEASLASSDGAAAVLSLSETGAEYSIEAATISIGDGTIPGDTVEWDGSASETFATPPLDVPLNVHTAALGGSSSFSDNSFELAAIPSRGMAWLNFGDDYAESVAIAGAPNVAHSSSRSRSYFQPLAAEKPSVYSGEQQSHTMSLTCRIDTRGTTEAHVSNEALRGLAASDTCILRLPGGARYKCAVDGVSWSEGADNGVTSCSINLTEVG